ncbi:hypothetical protein HMI54_005585 [Coelomomyces lativittatus]|nr:hypothetical protein HMI55_007117 [Coelomomyces lativittatus]KAJ1511346.1 hypothetical protein HMI56_005506 [Coelomomyces lativittatus]KAJ1517437.1 hypothetical protein HMI54_005585 [Coelomomyces lativittatus]
MRVIFHAEGFYLWISHWDISCILAAYFLQLLLLFLFSDILNLLSKALRYVYNICTLPWPQVFSSAVSTFHFLRNLIVSAKQRLQSYLLHVFQKSQYKSWPFIPVFPESLPLPSNLYALMGVSLIALSFLALGALGLSFSFFIVIGIYRFSSMFRVSLKVENYSPIHSPTELEPPSFGSYEEVDSHASCDVQPPMLTFSSPSIPLSQTSSTDSALPIPNASPMGKLPKPTKSTPSFFTLRLNRTPFTSKKSVAAFISSLHYKNRSTGTEAASSKVQLQSVISSKRELYPPNALPIAKDPKEKAAMYRKR